MFDGRTIRAVLVHPSLWATAIGAAAAFAPRGWWRRPPFLPVPDDEVIRWRVATAYGSEEAAIAPEDVVAYLRWRKRHRSVQG